MEISTVNVVCVPPWTHRHHHQRPMSQRPQTRTLTHETMTTTTNTSPSSPVTVTLLILLSLFVQCTTPYTLDFGLKWGQKCKIPGPNEFLKPSEECQMSKGLQCQSYQQGNLCGCLIRSSLSYDEYSGECRRKPGHHCPFINTTESPNAFDHLGYNHKCHTRAECMIVDPIPEVQATSSSSSSSSSSSTSTKKKSSSSSSGKNKQEQFAVCRCKRGYKESRDGLVCHSVNTATTTRDSRLFFTLLSILTTSTMIVKQLTKPL